MTYTARLNAKIVLPSGNWFSGFRANSKTRTIVYTYHDRRRAGQVARHYSVVFKADLSTIESVTAVSARAGRVEHFKSVSIREDLAIILRAAVREQWENEFSKEVEPAKEEKNFTLANVLYGLFLILMAVEIVTGIALFIIPEGTEVYETVIDVFFGSAFSGLATAFLAMHEINS